MRARGPGDPTPCLFSAAPSTSYSNSSLSPGLSGNCATLRTLRSRIVCFLCGGIFGSGYDVVFHVNAAFVSPFGLITAYGVRTVRHVISSVCKIAFGVVACVCFCICLGPYRMSVAPRPPAPPCKGGAQHPRTLLPPPPAPRAVLPQPPLPPRVGATGTLSGFVRPSEYTAEVRAPPTPPVGSCR